ncbi:flavodoxin, partial [Paramuribaculum intestinale]|uniref:flavodoxin n=2 Tax=Paramuribaculum intestinale TaxID=2094151 RepID=UPI00338E3D82
TKQYEIMKNTGIFYGSTTGTTLEVAEMIAKCLGIKESDIHNVATTAPSEVAAYDLLLLGTSTWGDGEMQDNMDDFSHGLEVMDLSGKEIALFGCGDESMSDTFCNAVGELYSRLKDTGAKFIGAGFGTDGYSFDSSEADKDGHAVGLLIDNVNHPDLTQGRIEDWCRMVAAQE